MKFQKIHKTIGKTPLVEIYREEETNGASIWAKIEAFNPGGSVKDRPALYMIEDAEKKGLLEKGGTIIEPTSGNTGIAMAMIGVAKGYKVVIVMPETMSIERRKLMEAYGAKIILTKGEEGMAGSVKLAKKLAKENGYFMPDQFSNLSNVKAHYETTGPEILEATQGEIDAFVVGVGTGGTITGAGRRLKEANSSLQIFAVEPEKSPLLSGGVAGPHGIQGIGANFIPSILDRELINRVIKIKDEEALVEAKNLGRNKGILCGISSGANMAAALKLAKKLGKDKTIVTVLPDTGERYLSTDLFNGA